MNCMLNEALLLSYCSLIFKSSPSRWWWLMLKSSFETLAGDFTHRSSSYKNYIWRVQMQKPLSAILNFLLEW